MLASLFFSFLLLFQSPIAITQPSPSPLPPAVQTERDDDSIRVNTDLIQIGVSVFDQKGKFVKNLLQEDFELRVDGKIVPINFFEAVSGQSLQNSVVSNDSKAATAQNPIPKIPNRRGRNILFVVDDVHLAVENFNRAKDLIQKFIETDKQPEDYVAIVSTTGKIGFLQQFTNDDVVLRAALERLKIGRDYSANDKIYPPISEFEAQEIDRNNKDVTDIFVEIALRDYPPNQRNSERTIEQVKEQIRSRAKNILFLSQTVSRNTYNVLEQSLRLSGRLNGRKIVFFLSDGFVLDVSNTNSPERITRITDVATRVNAVIYAVDTKGLDASLPEGTAASFSLAAGGRFESQDVLSAFAKNTGGSFIHNTNEPQRNVSKALEEASSFYLLAWEPEVADDKVEKFRKIEIGVRSNPKSQVRFQSGYLNANSQKPEGKSRIGTKKNDSPKNSENINNNDETKLTASDRDLQNALFSPVPIRNLNTSIEINYLEKSGEGSFLVGSLKVDGGSVETVRESGKALGKVQLVGILYDSDGNRIDYFNKLLSVEYAAALTNNVAPDVYYDFQTKVKPGLYQIRVAARDVRSGRNGSNTQWIEIPNLTSGKLELSSLFFAERKSLNSLVAASENKDLTETKVIPNVDRQLDRSSYLQCIFYIYNYTPNPRKTNYPELNIQMQVLRDNKLIAEIPFNQNSLTQIDPMQLVYAAEIPLQSLSTGQYQLQVKIKNSTAKSEAFRTKTINIK